MEGSEEVPEELLSKFKSDRFARSMGIEIVQVRKGYCKARMVVSEDMMNFNGVAHGGAIFSLADVAFAVASNSRGKKALAISMNIAFRRAVSEGEELAAEATELSLGKNTALYGIDVRDSRGRLVASCQGVVFIVGEGS